MWLTYKATPSILQLLRFSRLLDIYTDMEDKWCWSSSTGYDIALFDDCHVMKDVGRNKKVLLLLLSIFSKTNLLNHFKFCFMGKEKARAELQLLKAQIHPHFLFNTLNNIYFFTLTASLQAPEMIKKLTTMLHYILNECNQPIVSLEKELKMMQDYIALEKIRYGEQMDMSVEIQGSYSNKMIAPLLLIPFVENSFKHGASKMIAHPWIKLRITVEGNMLNFFISNSKPLTVESLQRNGSIGLKNVKNRLKLLYPGNHELNIISEPESFTVFLKIQLKELIVSPANPEETIQTEEYAMV